MPEEIAIENTTPINLLSTDVQEIISYQPHWIVRNGSLLFFVIISLLISSSFCINYPDIVTAPAIFTSINAPKEIKVKADGRLLLLLKQEGEFVLANEVIGFVESRASHPTVIKISAVTDSMELMMQAEKISEALALLDLNLHQQTHKFPETTVSLGELQQPFQIFMQSFYLFRQYLGKGFYLSKRKMLLADIDFLKHQHNVLEQQKTLQLEDLSLSKETIDANSTLQEQKVISPLDYRIEKSKYIAKQLSIPQISTALISNESGVHEKQREIAQLDNEISQQQNIFLQALLTFKSQADDWKSKYLLLAPAGGRVSFARFLQQDQQLKAGQTFCYVNPGNTTYFAEIAIPQNNFGKVKPGQQVLLKLSSYPYQEFGLIKGTLTQISTIPTDSGYIAKVLLPNGLVTLYKKQLAYKEGLKATGEIITADKKISERLMNQFLSLINSK